MNVEALLCELFPAGHAVTVADDVLTGQAVTPSGEIAVIGTTNHCAVGVETSLALAAFVLEVLNRWPGRPILMLVDTQGQRLSKKDELLGINAYLAHLVKCLEMARVRGHRLLTLVYGEAVSGGFLSFGLMADEIHALPEAKMRVMNLPAMAKITKLPLELLEELSTASPSFAPGAENFFKLGGVQSIWSPPLTGQLQQALERDNTYDHRREQGLARQGRKLAHPVAQRVLAG
jgi:malonate decarboxylase gamma subunit